MSESSGSWEGSTSFSPAPESRPTDRPTHRVALKTNNLETIVAVKRLSCSSPFLALFMHLPASKSRMGQLSVAAAEEEEEEDFPLHYTPVAVATVASAGGEKDEVRIAHYVM